MISIGHYSFNKISLINYEPEIIFVNSVIEFTGENNRHLIFNVQSRSK